MLIDALNVTTAVILPNTDIPQASSEQYKISFIWCKLEETSHNEDLKMSYHKVESDAEF